MGGGVYRVLCACYNQYMSPERFLVLREESEVAVRVRKLLEVNLADCEHFFGTKLPIKFATIHLIRNQVPFLGISTLQDLINSYVAKYTLDCTKADGDTLQHALRAKDETALALKRVLASTKQRVIRYPDGTGYSGILDPSRSTLIVRYVGNGSDVTDVSHIRTGTGITLSDPV